MLTRQLGSSTITYSPNSERASPVIARTTLDRSAAILLQPHFYFTCDDDFMDFGDGSIYVAHSPLRRAVGKAMYPELTQDITGGIARYKPIRLDLLARDAICAAQARAANASTLSQTTELAAIHTDIRQIKVLLKQAANALSKAVIDGDMTIDAAGVLKGLLLQSTANLAPANLDLVVTDMAGACRMFDQF